MTEGETSKRKPWAFLAFGLIAVLFLGLSMLAFPTTWNPGLPLILAGIYAVLVGAWRVGKGLGRYYRVESDLSTGLLLWMAVCTLFTLDLHLSQRSLGSFTGGVALIAACQAFIQSRKQWRGAAYSLVAISFFASVLAWIAALVEAKQTGVLPPLKGIFANHDTFSVLPLAAMCLTVGLVEKAEKIGTWVNLILTGFFLLTVYATGCRSALVGIVVAVLLFALPLQLLRRDKWEKTRLFVGFPMVLGLLFVPLVGYQYASSTKWGRLADGSAAEYESLRMELLEHGWKAILANPIFGSGPGAFGQAYQSVRPPGHEALYINIAHNDFLEMGVECGFPGLILWGALTWFAVAVPWSHLKDGRRPTEAAGVMCGVAALAAFSLFNFIVVQRPALWVQMWLFGLAFTFPNNRERWIESKALRYGGGLALICLGAWTAFWGFKSLKAEMLYLQAEQAERKLDIETAAELSSRAAEQETPLYLRAMEHQAILEKLRLFNGEDNLSQQLSILDEARQSAPKRIPLLLRLAEVQEKAGRPKEARSTLDAAATVAPYRRDVFEQRVTFLITQGSLQAAATSLTKRAYENWDEWGDELSQVLLALFQIEPTAGAEILTKWLTDHTEEKGNELPTQMARQAEKLEDWKTEQAVLAVWKNSRPADLCLEQRFARAMGNEMGKEREFQYLSAVLKRDLENSDQCYSSLLKRWTELGLQQEHDRQVEAKLLDFLKIAPYRHWATAQLGHILAGRGEYSQAVAVLREGLDKSPNDAELLMAMAQIFEQQGSTELAVNYYREVTRKHPDHPTAGAKLKKLLNKL